MRVWLYTRLSPDDDDGSDIAAQEAQLRADAEAAGHQIVGASRDSKVSGAVPPMERAGFKEAVEGCQAQEAELLARDWPRVTRQNPADAATALLDCPVHVHVARDNPIPAQTREAQRDDPMSAGMMFFSFFSGWQYRAAASKNARNHHQALRDGHKQTKSGKAPHRPVKLSKEEAVWAWEQMEADGSLSLTRVAHMLSEQRDAFAASITAKQRRDRMVSHKAVTRAFERYGIGQKPDLDERVTSKGAAGPGPKGALSPDVQGGSDRSLAGLGEGTKPAQAEVVEGGKPE